MVQTNEIKEQNRKIFEEIITSLNIEVDKRPGNDFEKSSNRIVSTDKDLYKIFFHGTLLQIHYLSHLDSPNLLISVFKKHKRGEAGFPEDMEFKEDKHINFSEEEWTIEKIVEYCIVNGIANVH